MGTKYDYISLRAQYVQADPPISIRELCRRNDIPTWSTVQAHANREGWDMAKAEFQRQVQSRSIEVAATKRANKIMAIEDDLLEVIHGGILKMAVDMDAQDPVMDGTSVLRDAEGAIVWRPRQIFGPNQLKTLVEQLMAVMGKPTQIAENRNLNLNANAEVGHDDLRTLLAALRPRAALAGAGGATEAGDPPRTRTN